MCILLNYYYRNPFMSSIKFWMMSYKFKVTEWYNEVSLSHFIPPPRHCDRPFLFHGYSQPVTTHDSFNYYSNNNSISASRSITLSLVPVNVFDQCKNGQCKNLRNDFDLEKVVPRIIGTCLVVLMILMIIIL